MTEIEVIGLANRLLAEHNLLPQWSFAIGKRKRSVGTCFYRQKRIEFSKHWLTLPDEQISDTILHEIAHALVGPGHGHGRVWKLKAMELGAIPKSCIHKDLRIHAPVSRWMGVCTVCRNQYNRHKKPSKNLACRACCIKYNGGKFHIRYKLQWIDRKEIHAENKIV